MKMGQLCKLVGLEMKMGLMGPMKREGGSQVLPGVINMCDGFTKDQKQKGPNDVQKNPCTHQ